MKIGDKEGREKTLEPRPVAVYADSMGDEKSSAQSMKAVVTTGRGGYERLEYREVAVPALSKGEVLIRVLAAGVNNTDINTRVGWYASSVATGTNAAAAESVPAADGGGWSGTTPFPLIQGTDCCGRVVDTASDVEDPFLERRVLVRPCMRTNGFTSMKTVWMGSDFDGAFAQYVKVPAGEVFPVESDLSDAELGGIPCAYGTAENMLHRARLRRGERVLVTGASGGVGSAVVQLARLRGAEVIAVAGAAKAEQVRRLGADRVIARGEPLEDSLAEGSIDLAVDNVAGDTFPEVVRLVRRGGRYVSSGAIGGPLVTLDLRTVYLHDLTLIGTTVWDEPVFPNLVEYLERGQIRPQIARTFPLADIADAQREFMLKRHVGKFVLIPPSD